MLEDKLQFSYPLGHSKMMLIKGKDANNHIKGPENVVCKMCAWHVSYEFCISQDQRKHKRIRTCS